MKKTKNPMKDLPFFNAAVLSSMLAFVVPATGGLLIQEDFEDKVAAQDVLAPYADAGIQYGEGNPLWIDGNIVTELSQLALHGPNEVVNPIYWQGGEVNKKGYENLWVAEHKGNKYLRLGKTESNFFLWFSEDGGPGGRLNFIASDAPASAEYDYVFLHNNGSTNLTHGVWLVVNTSTTRSEDGFTFRVICASDKKMIWDLRDSKQVFIASGEVGNFSGLLAPAAREVDNSHGAPVRIRAEWTGLDMKFYIAGTLVWASESAPGFNPGDYRLSPQTKVMFSGSVKLCL